MEIPYVVNPRRDTGLYNGKVGIWLFLASEVMLFGAFFSSYVLLRVNAPPTDWPHGLLNIPIGTFNTAVLITSSVTVVMAWASLKMGKLSAFKTYMAVTILCAMGFLGIKSYEYSEKWKHYEVWFKDAEAAKTKYPQLAGSFNERSRTVSITGHIEGNPYFWKTKTLKDKSLKELEFEAEPTNEHGMIKPPGHEKAEAGHDKAEGGHAKGGHEHVKVKVAVEDIQRLSAYVPGHSTFFSIYFTMTALHAIHVFAGALVMTYLLLTSGGWWKKAPAQLTNRVECAGLFWHFVDLVWIFLFPILYLL